MYGVYGVVLMIVLAPGHMGGKYIFRGLRCGEKVCRQR